MYTVHSIIIYYITYNTCIYSRQQAGFLTVTQNSSARCFIFFKTAQVKTVNNKIMSLTNTNYYKLTSGVKQMLQFGWLNSGTDLTCTVHVVGACHT